MKSLAALLLIVALVAAVLGFGGAVAGAAVGIAKIAFYVFLVLATTTYLKSKEAP